jgi:hypothetical protein
MKGNITKDGDVETTTKAKLKGLTIFDPEITIDILPKIQTWLAKGDISETTLLGSIRAQTFNGEILLRNNNILATNINWALTDAMDKVNALKISNNDIELIAGAGAQNSQLRISNTTGGKIRIRAGTNTGLQADAHDALSIFSDQASTQVVIAGGDAPSGYDTTSKLLVDHRNLNNGIKVTNHQNALITRVDHNNVNTPSLTLQSSWNGSTAKTLYLNASDELYYNGAKVNTGGGASGGITYYVSLVNSISPPASPPLEQTMSTTYTARPQQTITQTISANTAYYIADYVTEVFNKVANPILSGVQQLNQYTRWNSQNQTGNLYGRLWFQATSPINNILWNKSYTNPVTTNYATTLNGTPIIIPNGIYNLVFPKIVFPGIDIEPTFGQTAQLSCRIEARPASTGTFATLANYGGATINFGSNTLNQTITFSASTFTHNQTTNTPIFHNAIRLVLTCTNGQIRQTTAGAATNAGAYRIESTGSETASIRIMLKDTSSTPIVVPYSTTPILTEIDLPIDTPYDIAAFNYSTLSTDIYFIQPSGGFAGHTIQLYFNEGTITHFHSTIAQTGAVSDILAGTNINVANNGGAYTISNAAQVTNVTSSGNIGVNINNTTATITNTAPTQSVVAGPGINIVTNNFVSTINNAAAVQNVQAGSGINVSIAGGTATISTINNGGVGLNITEGANEIISKIGVPARKASWYGASWTAPTASHMFMDTYVSSTGSVVVYATRSSSNAQSGAVVSNNFGLTFEECPNQPPNQVHREWATICGLPNASKIWIVSNRVTSGGQSIIFNQIWSTTDRFLSMTQETAPADFANNNLVIELMRVSGDGKYMLITHVSLPNSNTCNLYKSSNYGASWNSQNIAPSLGWTRGCAMSADGKYQFVTIDSTSGGIRSETGYGGVYRSTDFGDTWTRTLDTISNVQIRRVECNATGQIVIIADSAETRISYDYGATWRATSPNITNSRCAAINAVGNIIWFGLTNGGFTGSVDFGRNFFVGNSSTFFNVPIGSLAMNSEGSIIFGGNINEFRRISCREPQPNVREVAVTNGEMNGLSVSTNSAGAAILTLLPPVLRPYYNSFQQISQGATCTMATGNPINLLDYNLCVRFALRFTAPAGSGQYTFFNVCINDIQGSVNKTIWYLAEHTNTDQALAATAVQSFNSTPVCYVNLNGSGTQSINCELEISMSSTSVVDADTLYVSHFRTSVGHVAFGSNQATSAGSMSQLFTGTIQTPANNQFYLSTITIRQSGSIGRAYNAKLEWWVRQRY